MTLTNNTIKLAGVATDPLLDLNTYPSLDLQFATTKTLNDEVSGTPLVDHQRRMDGANASPGTFVNSSGLIKTAKVNLLTYSEEFNTGWLASSVNPTPGAITAPYGLSTAYEITDDGSGGATGNAHIQQNMVVAVAASTVYTLSAYVKANPNSIIKFQTANDDAIRGGAFNLSTQVFTPNGFGETGTFESVGNDWYRCALTWTTGSDIAIAVKIGFDTITKDGTNSFYLWGAQLEEGTTATDYIKTTNYPSAAPRFDHDPATGESLGLLVEEERANYFTSSTPTSSLWAQYNGASITDNQATGPDGVTNSASLVTFPATGGAIPIIGAGSAGVSGTVTVSAYVRAVTGTVSLQIGTNVSYGTTQIVDTSWTRIEFTTTSLGTSAGLRSGDVNNVQNFYVWGGQIEIGSFPSSYIPTEVTTVTRAADTASITGNNFSSWYNQSEGTVLADFDLIGHGGQDTFIFGINAGNSITGKGLQVNTSVTGDVKLYQSDNGGSRPVIGVLGGANTPSKATYAYSSSGIYGSLDGGAIAGRALNAGLPVEDTLYIGRLGGLISIYNQYGHISRLTYYPYRLADATLQTITS